MRDRPDKRSSATVPLLALAASLLFGTWHLAFGTVPDEFKAKRQDTFEFTEKPTITRDGDKVTITFASKAFCDATVAIEDADGKIVRHLASGVLGVNAPEPFTKDALRQTIVWDSKDDQGEYLKKGATLVARVSLGAKPSFEKTLFWDPRKRAAFSIPRAGDGASKAAPIMVAAPEGVYVFDSGSDMDHLRLFDHDGNYVRTIYPFPAGKLDKVAGLKKHTFPQSGRELPFKNFFYGTTLLTSGVSQWQGIYGLHPSIRDAGFSASAIAVHKDRIALACVSLNRLSTDGSSGGLLLSGPRTDQAVPITEGVSRGNDELVFPRSAAFSPDCRWLYLTGYTWAGGRASHDQHWLHGVLRLKYEADDKAEVFVGSVKPGESGSKDGQFSSATCVACDKEGRVYVGDYMNDRIQVYSPEGKLIKTVRVDKPGQIVIHQRTQEIFVFSWFLMNQTLYRGEHAGIKPWLIHLGPLDDPKERARYPLPLLQYSETAHMDWTGLQYRFELDTWSDSPRVWLVPGGAAAKASFDTLGIRVYDLGDRELKLKHDFGQEAAAAVLRTRPCSEYRQRLYVNPAAPDKLYVGEGDTRVRKDFSTLLEIDVASGKVREIALPFPAEDACFDLNGYAYLRTVSEVVRFNPQTWREIPWDYGEDRPALNSQAALVLPANVNWHHGGMGVSPRGTLAVGCYYGEKVSGSLKGEQTVQTWSGKGFQPRLYPGRAVGPGNSYVHVFDKHGKLLHGDALPGLRTVDSVGIDREDRLYVAVDYVRQPGEAPYFDRTTGTLLRVTPGRAKIVSSSDKTPVPLAAGDKPKEAQTIVGAWVEGADWLYGGIGYAGRNFPHPTACACWNYRCALDLFGRSFAPEVQHCSVAVLDANGNLILRIGRYGNVDDGKPIVGDGGPAKTQAVGGDEVALFYAPYVATHTDRRLFIADAGNQRLLSVRLDYHATEKVALK